MFRIFCSIVVLLIGAMQFAHPAVAQEFPKKQPIKIVVTVPPGGGSDVLARITAEGLQRRLGQAVIVENKPGASSTIGVDFVSKAPADGYTLLFVGAEFAVVPAVRKKLPYRFEELTYLVRPFSVAPVIIGSPKYGPSTLQELLADMKARPGAVRYGSTGTGAVVHVGMASFESAAGVKGLHIPYQGIAPVLNDLLAGTIDISQSGSPVPEGLKALASAGTRRNPEFPNVPTLEEAGIKGATWDVWWGFFAPPNLPKPIAERLIAEITAVTRDPASIAKYKSVVKFEPEANPLTGEAFKQQVLEDSRKWKTVVDREKITIE
jgi:tripartite-type tricarboxylate transporter receptor subunit TctC